MSTGAPSAGHALREYRAALRMSFAGTTCLLACELMQWSPTFLAPVLAVALLANLPGQPPAKVIVALVLVTVAAATGSFVMASLLRFVPALLVAAIALCSLLCFLAIAHGRPVFPALLTLICLATVPVAVLVAPAQAGALPRALIRGITLALIAVWLAHALFPAPRQDVQAAPQAPAVRDTITPLLRAVVSVAVVVPMMLVFLLFGLTDALPVLIATVMLVVTFDARRSRMQALAMVLGNFAGGLIGLLLYAALCILPNPVLLALLVHCALLLYGRAMARGGPAAPALLITCNATLIILASAIATGPAPLSLWLSRLFQFAIAGAISVSLMTLFWRCYTSRPAAAAPKRPFPTSPSHRSTP